MKPSEFISETASFFERNYSKLISRLRSGPARGNVALPAMIRAGISPHHLMVELLGVQLLPESGRVRLDAPASIERVRCTSAFFNPGFSVEDSSTPVLSIAAKHHEYENLGLCTHYDEAVFKEKVNFDLKQVMIKYADAEIPLAVRPAADYIVLQDIVLIRTDTFRVQYRFLPFSLVVNRDITKGSLRRWLTGVWDRALKNRRVRGVRRLEEKPEIEFGRQLLGLADQDLGERILDRLIQSHGAMFAKALGYTEARAHQVLKWVDRNDDEPEKSVPDYMMLRTDGRFDILDLKKAAIQRPSITKGLPARVRFIDYVSELIAQLNTYERYFARPHNAEWAREHHGITVADPLLIGVVGNHDTFDHEDVSHALEAYRKEILIISYADVVDLLFKR